jgi:alpha-glucosidase
MENNNDDQNWWRGGVIYQIYPRSFFDSNADGTGDIRGIGAKLNYIASLGVDAIWLSPFFRSPMKDFGYDVEDYCDVDPIFGNLEDFKRLLRQAHDLRLRVIIDQVYSHSSDQHPWFRESCSSRNGDKSDWYVWADPKADGTPPNNWLAVFGGPAWTWEPRRQQYYLHNFLPSQPDLNFHNPQVRKAVLECAEFWLKLGVDGFRIDVANFYCHDRQLRDNPPRHHPDPVKPCWLQRPLYNRDQDETLSFVSEFRALLDQYPQTMAVAELASEDELGAMARYTSGKHSYHTAYSFVFLRPGASPMSIRSTLETFEHLAPDGWPSWAFSNHDVVRSATRWAKGNESSTARKKTLIALLCSLRGTAFLYQGEELGLPQAEVPYNRIQDPEGLAFWPNHKGRDGARTPIPWEKQQSNGGFSSVDPWLPVDPQHLSLAVDAQDKNPESALNFARQFIAWRQSHPVFRVGSIKFWDTAGRDGLIVFERKSPNSLFLCSFNLGSDDCVVTLSPGCQATIAFDFGKGSVLSHDTITVLPESGCFIALEDHSQVP